MDRIFDVGDQVLLCFLQELPPVERTLCGYSEQIKQILSLSWLVNPEFFRLIRFKIIRIGNFFFPTLEHVASVVTDMDDDDSGEEIIRPSVEQTPTWQPVHTLNFPLSRYKRLENSKVKSDVLGYTSFLTKRIQMSRVLEVKLRFWNMSFSLRVERDEKVEDINL